MRLKCKLSKNSGIRNLALYHKITFARNYPQLFATDLPAGLFSPCFRCNYLHAFSCSNQLTINLKARIIRLFGCWVPGDSNPSLSASFLTNRKSASCAPAKAGEWLGNANSRARN
jgi:hypothetical protein